MVMHFSIVVINDNVIFSADTGLTETKLTCSLNLKEHGEVRLPKKVELLGADNSLEGK